MDSVSIAEMRIKMKCDHNFVPLETMEEWLSDDGEYQIVTVKKVYCTKCLDVKELK